MDADLREFLAALFDGVPGYIEVRALPGKHRGFFSPDDVDGVERFAEQHQHQNLFFGVATRTSTDGGSLEYCGLLTALFVDIDCKIPADIDQARLRIDRASLPPSMTVCSGGGLHVYWSLAEPIDLQQPGAADETKALLRRLALAFGGDLAAAECARVLRVPDSTNCKYDPARPVTIETFEPERRYALSDFDVLPIEPQEPAAAAQAAPGATITEGGRNAALTSLAGSLRRRGVSAETMLAALVAENTTRCIPPLDEAEVRQIAESIGRYTPADETSTHAARVVAEAAKLRVRRAAQQVLAAEDRGALALPEILTLRDRLARPVSPVLWRVARFQTAQSRALLAAQYKTGKSTVVGNYLRSLADGDPFLGLDAVVPVAGTAVLLDFEMGATMLDAWLRAQRIRHDDRVVPIPLRGMAGAFNILDAGCRREWAQRLRDLGAEVLVLDCLRPVLDALGLDEHRDTGRFLVPFDELLQEAGIPDALVVHHMGHAGERSRGDSRLRDWPDCEWRLVRRDEDPASPRFMTAFGRDVDVPESQLAYDEHTRRLTLAGGSRRDADRAAALDDVLAVLRASTDWLSSTGVETACDAAGSDYPRATIRAALKHGIRTGHVRTKPGDRRAILHQCAKPPQSAASAPADYRASAPPPIEGGALSALDSTSLQDAKPPCSPDVHGLFEEDELDRHVNGRVVAPFYFDGEPT